MFQGGEITADDLYAWSRHVLDSERTMSRARPTNRRAAYAGHLARMTAIKKSLDSLGPKECPELGLVQSVDYWLKEAEFWSATNR